MSEENAIDAETQAANWLTERNKFVDDFLRRITPCVNNCGFEILRQIRDILREFATDRELCFEQASNMLSPNLIRVGEDGTYTEHSLFIEFRDHGWESTSILDSVFVKKINQLCTNYEMLNQNLIANKSVGPLVLRHSLDIGASYSSSPSWPALPAKKNVTVKLMVWSRSQAA